MKSNFSRKLHQSQHLHVRALAARALAPVLSGNESLSDTLPAALAAAPALDRGLLQALTFTACRHVFFYRALLQPLLQRNPPPIVEALLLIGLAQLRDLRIPDHAALSETVNAARELGQDKMTGLINAVLRRYLREKDTLEAEAESFLHAHPEWLKILLEKDWGPVKAAALMQANNQEGPLTLRVNQHQSTRENYLTQLMAAEINATACSFSPAGIRVDAVSDVRTLPDFGNGAVSVQDEAAQLAALLLDTQPGMHVLDACAAPGGKTAHILEASHDISLVALDISPQRCLRIEENLQRLHLQNSEKVKVVAADAAQTETWWDGKLFQRILLDAPCTATGVIRRHPDIKLLRRQSDVAQTVALQAQLLNALWPLLAPGGVLLYATCSVLKAENEGQITRFLHDTADAREDIINAGWGEVRPHGRQIFTEITDGFYYARLLKTTH
jgi:16S rRNA (cytosine967-C5)-methyltransferase